MTYLASGISGGFQTQKWKGENNVYRKLFEWTSVPWNLERKTAVIEASASPHVKTCEHRLERRRAIGIEDTQRQEQVSQKVTGNQAVFRMPNL